MELAVKNQTLAIAVVERVPAYLWCAGTPENQGTCYFMDNAGYIFSEAPNFSGHTYFAYYGMISADNPVRLTYLDSKQFEDLNLIQSGLVKIGLPTFAENSSADGARELYLNSGGKIIFKNTADPAMLISSLSMVKSQTSILNQGAQPLDYIDMRFGNKVYYKFVGDNAIQASP